MTEKNPSLSSNIQNWVLIAIMVGGLIASYAANTTRSQDVERRVSNLEQQAITRNEYQELLKRLDRIEGKVDQIRK